MIDGRLHLGLGHAGEIGHVTVVPDGPLCGCGNRGCLDRVAAAAAIAEDAGHASVADAVTAARAGDTRARAALARAGRHVGLALAGAVVLLWPERIVVGGGVARAGDLILDPLRDELAHPARRSRPSTASPSSRPSSGAGAGAVGAALWALPRP